jgi:hypothetical protein
VCVCVDIVFLFALFFSLSLSLSIFSHFSLLHLITLFLSYWFSFAKLLHKFDKTKIMWYSNFSFWYNWDSLRLIYKQRRTIFGEKKYIMGITIRVYKTLINSLILFVVGSIFITHSVLLIHCLALLRLCHRPNCERIQKPCRHFAWETNKNRSSMRWERQVNYKDLTIFLINIYLCFGICP